MTTTKCLEVRDVYYTYPSFPPVHALRGVSQEIREGEIYALLGPNGAGKSTLVHLILALLKPDKGEVVFRGDRIRPDNKELLAGIGFEPQENILWEHITVKEHLEIMGTLHGVPRSILKQRIERLLSSLKMEKKARSLARNLSGGMKRRLQLMIALINAPNLLLLDEPSGGLDPQSRHFLWDFVKKEAAEGKSVLLTTHLMEEAQRVADKVGIIDNGKLIAEGKVEELIQTYKGDSLEDVFIGLTGRSLRE